MRQSSPLRALTHYKELPPVIGWHTMILALFARAPYAMLPLGIMTAFTASSGDLAVGGLAAGVFSIAVAFCSPLVGRASDMWGQRTVLLTLIPLNSLALLGLYWAATSNLQGIWLWLLCAVAGATIVPVGSFVRARWAGASPSPRVLNAAFSYESMVDELVFVLGPALVGISASLAAPAAPLLLAFILMATAGLAFGLSTPANKKTTLDKDVSNPPILRILFRVFPAVIALACIGTFFGATQAGVTARADLLGEASQAGLIYAIMGVGSAFAALLVVTLPERYALPWRFITFSLGMTAATLLVMNVDTLAKTGWAFLLAGIFVGPTLVTAFTIAERLAPAGGIAVAMTLMQSSVTVGVSAGSAAGGAIAQGGGPQPAFLLAAGASLTIAFVGVWLALRTKTNERHLRLGNHG